MNIYLEALNLIFSLVLLFYGDTFIIVDKVMKEREVNMHCCKFCRLYIDSKSDDFYFSIRAAFENGDQIDFVSNKMNSLS